MPAIRFANDDDLDRLEAIENDADRLFLERFHPADWIPAASGRTRAAQPGFLLVAAETAAAEPVGFAHIVELGGDLHLEQLAVRLEAGRRGHGRAMVEAALAEVARRGHERMTLRTYADVPWNAPYYARLGFVESEPDTEPLRALVEQEARAGLAQHGRRVQMVAGTVSAARDSVPPDHL